MKKDDSAVLVVTTDTVRGSLVHAVLKKSGFGVHWSRNFLQGVADVQKRTPRVAIFDAKGYTAGTIGLVEKFHHDFFGNALVVLADKTMIPPIEALGMINAVCLAEPFDPELIVDTVREYFSRKPAAWPKSYNPTPVVSILDDLTETMKDFLKLG